LSPHARRSQAAGDREGALALLRLRHGQRPRHGRGGGPMNGERLRWLRTRLSRLFRRGKQEAALDAELQFHLEQLVEQFRAEGMSESEARLAARRELGDVGSYREEI